MKIVEDVACTVCGCVCDDLKLSIVDGRITEVTGACHLSEDWFLEQGMRKPSPAQVEQVAVPVEQAIIRAGRILATAKWPLIYGLSRSSTDGQRAAVRLADAIRGNVDTTASLCHAPSIMAIQEVGESTCSLGEIKNRADLVIFWGVDPLQSHPRHFERYSVEPIGQFVPEGRSGRTVVVIDTKETESAKAADVFIQVPEGSDFEILWTLRGMLTGLSPVAGTNTGVALGVLESLLQRMKLCRNGVFFFGLGLAQKSMGAQTVEALLRLTRDLNAFTRFYARRMRMHGDVTGADTVLCWQTGYPFSVNLTNGYPRYNPGEYSANEMLARGEVDACLLVGCESLPQMSPAARNRLARIPTILLDYPHVRPTLDATVRFTTSVYGIHAVGTAYRMDEVPIPLRQVLPRQYACDAEVLRAIEDACRHLSS